MLMIFFISFTNKMKMTYLNMGVPVHGSVKYTITYMTSEVKCDVIKTKPYDTLSFIVRINLRVICEGPTKNIHPAQNDA